MSTIPIKIIVALSLAVAILLGLNYIYEEGKTTGKTACEAIQAKAQVKHIDKVKASDDKIDQSIPNAGDNNAVDQFLLSHTR